jgi:hypothetical protein
MSQVPRLFTVDEANALVPQLQLELAQVAKLRGDLTAAIEALGGADTAVAILQKGAPAPAGRAAEAEELKALAARIQEIVGRIGALGAVVKDLEAGLVDFYSVRDGEPIFLCWQLGEPLVAHWHPVDEGFSGRQPIEGVEYEPPQFPN